MSKVKVVRSRDQFEPSWSSAVPVSLEAGGGIPCRPNPAATLLVNTRLCFNNAKLRQDKISTKSDPGIRICISRLIRIRIRMCTGSLPKYYGFISWSASVISPSVVRHVVTRRRIVSQFQFGCGKYKRNQIVIV